MTKRISKLIIDVESGNAGDAIEAAKKISFNTISKDEIEKLASVANNGKELHSREAATYALSNINNIDESLLVLIDLLDSSINHESVRGRAAEGIANIKFSRKKNIKKKAEYILIKCLQDPSPTVRFWSCFAVGVLRFKKALPILKEIKSNDHEICPGWWYVSEEAEDAIKSINGRHGKNRISVNQRSSSIPYLLE